MSPYYLPLEKFALLKHSLSSVAVMCIAKALRCIPTFVSCWMDDGWVLKLNLKLFSGNTFVCMILFFIRLYFLLIRCTLHWTAQTSLHLGYRCKTTLGECPCTVKGLLLVMQLHSSEYHLCFKGLFKIKPTPMPVGSVKQGHEGRIPVQSINCNKIQTIRNVSVYHFSF